MLKHKLTEMQAADKTSQQCKEENEILRQQVRMSICVFVCVCVYFFDSHVKDWHKIPFLLLGHYIGSLWHVGDDSWMRGLYACCYCYIVSPLCLA